MKLKYLYLASLIFVGLVLFTSLMELPPVGDPHSPANTHVSPRYIEKGFKETGAHNLVTAVLADYRGLDTLGETTVVFIAGLACLAIFGLERKKRS